MQQFEIKIFANPSGFQELKLNNNAENLFPKEIIEKRNFDGDYGTFREGTFSVLFTPKSFIIDYIFNAVADANFRDPQTHIAIAIERGYMLKNAYQVFTSLRKEFNLIAAEAKVNIITALHSKGEVFNSIVENNIEFAPDQFRISTGEKTVIKRALASYETEEQLNSLLEEPNRLKFDSYDLVYFLKKIDASELYKKESIKKYYAPIKMDDEDFNFSVSYEVIFPDNSKVTIKSRYDEIDHTCTKMYYKSERFYGTLNEHMQDWQVTQSEDRTKFYIRKELTPERKEFRILCYDSRHNLTKTPSSLRFNKGSFSHQRGILVLTGEDISAGLNYSLDDQSLMIKQIELGTDSDSISFEITKLNAYNVSGVFSHVREKTGETVSEIKIYQKGSRVPLATLTPQDPCHYDKLGPDSIVYEIPETKKYSSIKVGFNDSCTPKAPQLQKKDTADIELIIQDESIVRNLNKRPVYCQYKNAHEEGEEKYPLRKPFDEDGHLVLQEQPFGEFSYKVEIRGFRTIEQSFILSKNSKAKQIELKFKKTTWNKTLNILNKYKGSLAMFLIGLVLGGFLRPYIRNPQYIGKGNNGNKAPQDTIISRLKKDSAELRNYIISLENKCNKLDSINRANKFAVTDALNAADGGYTNAGQSLKSPQSEIKNSERHPEEIEKIIHLDSGEKQQLTNSQSWIYKKVYNKLSEQEKREIKKVIEHEAYLTLSIPNQVKTIEDAVKYLDEQAGYE